MRIGITGAFGMIGSSLTAVALDEGHEVVAIIRPDSKNRGNLPKSDRIVILECALADLETLMGKEKCDVFFHLAWENTTVGGRDDVQTQSKNIEHTLCAVNVAHSWGASTFVGAGSQAEYGHVKCKICGDTPTNPESGYGIAKYAAGRLSRLLCKQMGMRFCWARILSVYGEGDNPNSLIMYLIRTIMSGGAPELTKCDQIWDYIYSYDAATALLNIGLRGKDGKTYCVGSGECRPLNEYVIDVRDSIDPSVEIKFGVKEYYPHQVMMLCADIRELTQDTGFVPKYSFKEGISRTLSRMNMKRTH